MRTISKLLLASLLVGSLTGCLTKRTVTQNGSQVSNEYVFRRPFKEAAQNSR